MQHAAASLLARPKRNAAQSLQIEADEEEESRFARAGVLGPTMGSGANPYMPPSYSGSAPTGYYGSHHGMPPMFPYAGTSGNGGYMPHGSVMDDLLAPGTPLTQGDESVPPILRVPQDALSQLELMLESIWHRAAENTMNIAELSKTLSNKQDLLELQQSNYRNFILSVSLRMSIIGVAASLGAFLTSAFGMNIANGLEDSQTAFWFLSGMSVGVGIYVYERVNKLIQNNSPTVQHARRLQAFQDLLFKLDSKVDTVKRALAAAQFGGDSASATALTAHRFVSDGTGATRSHILPYDSSDLDSLVHAAAAANRSRAGADGADATLAGDDDRTLTKADFRRLYEEFTGRTMAPDELDLMFDLLDANGDGELQLREVAGIFFQQPEGVEHLQVGEGRPLLQNHVQEAPTTAFDTRVLPRASGGLESYGSRGSVPGPHDVRVCQCSANLNVSLSGPEPVARAAVTRRQLESPWR